MIGQLLRCVCCRNPQITLLQQWIEGLGHYAQHDVGQSVNARALPDYRGIRMEPCAPQTLADDGDLREPRFILVGSENASGYRLNGERGKVTRGGDFALHPFGSFLGC